VLRQADAHRREQAPPPWDDTTEVPMAHILVIDDDIAVRRTVQLALEQEKYEVICASDGDEGLRAYAKKAPRLVIVDIFMPNKDGIETIMKIRASDATTPIIAMSGGGHIVYDNFLDMARSLGASEVICKPFEREDLTAVVSRLLTA
jgi:DNA-binding response OmpR family regulator